MSNQQEVAMSGICQECGLPIKACNRIATLEHQVKYLARAVLQLSKDAARTWDYDGEQMTGQGVPLDRETEVKGILERR